MPTTTVALKGKQLKELRRIANTLLTLTITLALSACTPYNEPAPDHYRDQVSHESYKLEHQDAAWLMLRARLQERYNKFIPNLLEHDWEDNVLNVWWVDGQPCPSQPERNAVVGCKDRDDCPPRCFAGIMWGCAEIYVATWQKDPSSAVRGTALLHEYAHCMREVGGWRLDPQHEDEAFWDYVGDVEYELSGWGW